MSLKEAPESVQLAVDLIYLLESHHIDPKTALEALEIVRQDYEKKIGDTISPFIYLIKRKAYWLQVLSHPEDVLSLVLHHLVYYANRHQVG